MIVANLQRMMAGPVALLKVMTMAVVISSTCHAEDLLTVELASGRSYTGTVDSRTDAERLWLRYGTRSTNLIRPIAWDRIVRAVYLGNEIDLKRLPQMAESMKSTLERRDHRYFTNRYTTTTNRQAGSPTTQTPNDASRAQTALGASPRVRSVRFDAYIANWDDDVEVDGIILHVHPMAADGQLAKVSGTLNVELMAPRLRSTYTLPHGRGSSVDRIAQWTRQIWAEDIGPSGTKFYLPFQALHPEFDTDVNAYGLVHVRLAIPGHGVFDDSQDAVRIRPFSPLRDELQRSGRNRFLPTERTGR